jgi:hypothetical protein
MKELTHYFIILNCGIMKYYTITDFCRSEYEFLLTCKITLTEAEGWGQYWFCRSTKTMAAPEPEKKYHLFSYLSNIMLIKTILVFWNKQNW